MCQLSSDKIGVEHTLFTGNSGPQYFCELKSLQNHNLLKGAAWLTPVSPLFVFFSFLLFCSLLIFLFVSLRLPMKQTSTAALYQLETSLYPIYTVSPEEILETGLWNI